MVMGRLLNRLLSNYERVIYQIELMKLYAHTTVDENIDGGRESETEKAYLQIKIEEITKGLLDIKKCYI